MVLKAREEFDKEFDSEFDKEFRETIEEEVGEMFPEGFLSENDVQNLTDTFIETSKNNGSYRIAYDEAYDSALGDVQDKFDEMYEKAVDNYKLNEDTPPVPVTLYENFYKNEEEDNTGDAATDGTIRVYKKTDNINLASLMEGSLPETDSEIAIDRMHADNVKLHIGDEITVGGQTFKIVGLIAYVNYTTLHEKNTDFMFDALQFDVAMVTEEGFNRLPGKINYDYAWVYRDSPADKQEEKTLSENLLKSVLTQSVTNDAEIQDFIPLYSNSAVWFAPDDMGSDKAMGGVLLDVLIVIIAFIFAITITNTMQKESSAIGTLRAMGYTRKELILHYISMPVIVTLLSAVIGNILGYTLFTKVITGMYYNSYSLPEYHQRFNSEAFVKTTIIPVILMLAVNLLIVARMMKHTPLQFLRRNFEKRGGKRTLRLPAFRFINRFRLRVILQNIPHYATLMVGILFISILLAMAVGLPSTLNHYISDTDSLVFCNYQYVLSDYTDKEGDLIETDNSDAEKFDLHSLQLKGDKINEEISVYGISENSRYVNIGSLSSLRDNEVYVSESYSDKYNVLPGDTITLDEKYENKQYSFTVAGIYDQSQSLAVFLPLRTFEDTFDLKEDQFTGFLSDTEITDIDEDQIAAVITVNDIMKMANQLNHSMGSYMTYFQYLCILISAILIYLLTKIIVEKNEVPISMTKILGYTNREISGLYLHSTTFVVIVGTALCTILGCKIMGILWEEIMRSYSGWFTFLMSSADYIKIFSFIFIGYLLVLILDYRRISKIPMDQALKNVL